MSVIVNSKVGESLLAIAPVCSDYVARRTQRRRHTVQCDVMPCPTLSDTTPMIIMPWIVARGWRVTHRDLAARHDRRTSTRLRRVAIYAEFDLWLASWLRWPDSLTASCVAASVWPYFAGAQFGAALCVAVFGVHVTRSSCILMICSKYTWAKYTTHRTTKSIQSRVIQCLRTHNDIIRADLILTDRRSWTEV